VETYDITLSIKVAKTSNKEVVADEMFLFNGQSFAKMADRSDKFYELITALQKIK
jgi:hypothetical protein